MTYDLTIGKMEIDVNEYDGEIETHVYAVWAKSPDAPALPGSFVSRHTNHISIPWGGYDTDRRHFASVDEKLADLLFRGSNDNVNIKITPELLDQIGKARQKYRELNPTATPAFDSQPCDAVLARMEILYWWSEYSLCVFGDKAIIHIS